MNAGIPTLAEQVASLRTPPPPPRNSSPTRFLAEICTEVLVKVRESTRDTTVDALCEEIEASRSVIYKAVKQLARDGVLEEVLIGRRTLCYRMKETK